MTNSVTEDADHTNQSHEMTVDDSTTATIEFLRARLLSERSITKTTRERADELAKRVSQLEEQLHLATLQRKQAEKATSEVLAILESHGISDLSEVCDSCSDQEGVVGVSKKIDDIGTDEVNSTTSGLTEIKDQESKGLDLDVSSSVSRSLSWNSCSDNLNSREAAKGLAKPKRHGSFVSTSGSSTKHQLRKSRRQIRQRETRSSEAKLNEEAFLLDAHTKPGNASQCITDITKLLEEGHEEKKVYAGNSVQSLLEDQRKKGQSEAQESSQREWEKKVGNNCSSLDSCEHGNHLDITEERDDTRTETSEAVDTNSFIEQGGKGGREQIRDNEEAVKKDSSMQFVPHPHHDIRYSKDQQHINSTGDQSQSTCAEFSFPSQLNLDAKSNEKRKPEWPKSTSRRSVSHNSSDHQVAKPHSFHAGGSPNKADSSRNESQVAIRRGYPNSLGSVLDALQQAKLSLNSLASSTTGRTAVGRTKAPAPSITSGSAKDIPPVGCAGLFKVPTSVEFEAPVKRNSLSYPTSDSRYYPDGRHSSSPYLDNSAENSIRNPFLDPHMDKRIGLPSSGRYLYPSYIDSMPKTSQNNGFSRTHPSMGLQNSTEDIYSEYSNQTRFDLYRG